MIDKHMKKFEGITIISDMDGTLLNDSKEISAENQEAVSYFIENGGNFSIASGRIFSRLRMYNKVIRVTLPVISMNGMMIQDFSTGRVLYSEQLDQNAKKYTKMIFERYPHLGLEIYTGDTVHFIHRNRHIDKHISDEGFNLDICALDEVTDEWRKVLFGCDENLLEIIEREFPYMKEKVHFTKSDAHFYEILAKGANKGSALHRLTELAQIDPSRVIAVGDNINDLEFIREAGAGAAVANADEAVKAHSRFVLTQNNNQAPMRELIGKLENGEIVI